MLSPGPRARPVTPRTSVVDDLVDASWLPGVAVTLALPVVLGLVIGLRSEAHRVPCLVALTLGAVVVWLRRRRAAVIDPRRRFGLEALGSIAVGTWLAIALWAVLNHHR